MSVRVLADARLPPYLTRPPPNARRAGPPSTIQGRKIRGRALHQRRKAPDEGPTRLPKPLLGRPSVGRPWASRPGVPCSPPPPLGPAHAPAAACARAGLPDCPCAAPEAACDKLRASIHHKPQAFLQLLEFRISNTPCAAPEERLPPHRRRPRMARGRCLPRGPRRRRLGPRVSRRLRAGGVARAVVQSTDCPRYMVWDIF